MQEWSSAYALVRENIGVTLVPETTLPIQRHGMRVVPLKPGINREFALVAAANQPASAGVQTLIGMLGE
ncbi:LysR substrate binding domain protein [compost metagenome]